MEDNAHLHKCEGDALLPTLVTSGTALSLTNNRTYEAKVVIDNDPNNSALRQLRFWVDTDGDGDYSDETTLTRP